MSVSSPRGVAPETPSICRGSAFSFRQRLQPRRHCAGEGATGARVPTPQPVERGGCPPHQGLPFGTRARRFSVPLRAATAPRVGWSEPVSSDRRLEPPDPTPLLARARGRRSEPPGSRAISPPSRTPAVCTWTSDGPIHVPSRQTTPHCRHGARCPGMAARGGAPGVSTLSLNKVHCLWAVYKSPTTRPRARSSDDEASWRKRCSGISLKRSA